MKKSLLPKIKIVIPSKHRNSAMSIFLTNNLRFVKSEIDSDRNLIIQIYAHNRNRFEKALKKNCIESQFYELPCILSPILALRKRFGILIGMIMLIISLYYSSNVVWRININGNEKLSEQEIIAVLESVGFGIGEYIPKVDYDTLHNRALLNCSDLAWISVNIEGNVANVYVREKISENQNESPKYANVIAKCDGHIASIIVIDGNKEIIVGEVVKKGDVLISGVIDSQSEGVRYVCAKGEVMAYVNKQINVKIPFDYEEKIYTGTVRTKKEYKIFNFPLKFSLKSNKYNKNYDTIKKNEKLCLFGVKEIPFETIIYSSYEYRIEKVHLTKEEAVDLAFVELRGKLDSLLKDCEIVTKDVKYDYDSEFFYLSCDLYCLENIAEQQEFFITE